MVSSVGLVGKVLRSGLVRTYFGDQVAGLADGLDVGGEEKKKFKGNSQVWG